jgi:hypothetical protein
MDLEAICKCERGFLDMLAFDPPKKGVVETPMLVIDANFSAAEVRKKARPYGTEAKRYPDTGHNLMLEPSWREVAGDIADWLTIGPRGPRRDPAQPIG